jgi:hypothetical protein
MASHLLPPRYSNWPHWSAAAAALLGLAAGFYVDWYFSYGPGATSPDRGEAHAIIASLLGLPFSLLPWHLLGGYGPRVGLALSIAAAWALVGAVLGGIAAVVIARVRGDDSWAHPPAG